MKGKIIQGIIKDRPIPIVLLSIAELISKVIVTPQSSNQILQHMQNYFVESRIDMGAIIEQRHH